MVLVVEVFCARERIIRVLKIVQFSVRSIARRSTSGRPLRSATPAGRGNSRFTIFETYAVVATNSYCMSRENLRSTTRTVFRSSVRLRITIIILHIIISLSLRLVVTMVEEKKEPQNKT